MNIQKMIFLGAATLAVLALVGGGMLVLAYGFTPPPWLLVAELAAGSALALLVGFTACIPTFRALRPWLRLRPVQGAALVVVGVAAIYLPPQFIASAAFLALGIKLVWAEACELAEAEKGPVPVGTVIREDYDLVEPPPEAARLPSPASREIARRPVRRSLGEGGTVRDTTPARHNGGR
jgi:hypothetical protein